MGSQEQWPAAKVRETFLEYFRKNGHTFGMLPSLYTSTIAADMSQSAFFLGRTTFRSNFTVCKCRNEPV